MVEDTPDDLVFELHNEALWGDAPVRLLDSRHARALCSRLGVPRSPRSARARVPPRAARGRRVGQRGARAAAGRPVDARAGRDVPSGDRRPLAAAAAASPRRRRSRHVSARGAQTHIVAGTYRGSTRRSASLSAAASQHAARRRHELAPLPARARGAGARVLGLHVSVLPRRCRDAWRLRRDGAGIGERRAGRDPRTSFSRWSKTACRPTKWRWAVSSSRGR